MSQCRLSGRTAPVNATVRVPGSKSVANRALVCALLADGVSTIEDIPAGDDVAAMLSALAATGRVVRTKDRIAVTGGVAHGPLLAESIDCALAGTTSRFLTAVASLSATPVSIDGGVPLRARPMGDLHEALRTLGAHVEAPNRGHLPVTVSRSGMRGGRVRVRGDASSQFISALMLIAPLLAEGLIIEIEGSLVSRPYVEMTSAVMQSFGADVRCEDAEVIVAPRPYLPRTYRIEPDYSSAAFPLGACLLAGGRVRIPGLALAQLQGDQRILDLVRDMGAVVGVDKDDVVVVAESPRRISPLSVDLSDCSDLVPVVATVLGFADGVSRLGGIGFIAAKESNRLADLASELGRAGIAVTNDSAGLTIHGATQVRTATFDTHHDHRLAMALSLVSLAGVDVTIDDADVVAKSWPSFFDDMSDILNVDVKSH